MSEGILIAFITGATTLVGTVITVIATNRASTRDLYAKLDKQSIVADEKLKARMDVFQADLRTLSNRVDAHNNLIARTYALERRADVNDERLTGMNDRLRVLENDGK